MIAAAFCALAAFARAEAPALSRPTAYVTDLSGVFPPPRAARLNEKLAAFERATSTQILVYVASHVPDGTTMEELSSRALRDWGVGQKGRSNGVIFFVFPADRKMRVEVGYGLEGALPDAIAHRITDEIVKPHFRAGDFATGIEAGVDAICAAARGEPFVGTGQTASEGRAAGGRTAILLVIFGVIALWIVIAALRKRAFTSRRARVAGLDTAPSTGAQFIPIIPPVTTSYSGSSSSSSSSPSSSSGFDSSSSSSSSSSDFSGGGGDGGGGGSSDSW